MSNSNDLRWCDKCLDKFYPEHPHFKIAALQARIKELEEELAHAQKVNLADLRRYDSENSRLRKVVEAARIQRRCAPFEAEWEKLRDALRELDK